MEFYQNNLKWSTKNKVIERYYVPFFIYEKVFGGGGEIAHMKLKMHT
jgi:hypothetical protein